MSMMFIQLLLSLSFSMVCQNHFQGDKLDVSYIYKPANIRNAMPPAIDRIPTVIKSIANKEIAYVKLIEPFTTKNNENAKLAQYILLKANKGTKFDITLDLSQGINKTMEAILAAIGPHGNINIIKSAHKNRTNDFQIEIYSKPPTSNNQNLVAFQSSHLQEIGLRWLQRVFSNEVSRSVDIKESDFVEHYNL